MITGDVTEFGRKVVGDHQLFGILGRGKEQLAYAKVALNVVDVETSEVVYSSQGAGRIFFCQTAKSSALAVRQVMTPRSTGKVLDLAIRQAVDGLVNGIETGAWRPGN